MLCDYGHRSTAMPLVQYTTGAKKGYWNLVRNLSWGYPTELLEGGWGGEWGALYSVRCSSAAQASLRGAHVSGQQGGS